jgi:hypothetical protein
VCEFEYLCLCEKFDTPSVYYFNNNLLHNGGNSDFKMFPNNGEGKLCPQSTRLKLVKGCKSVAIRSVIFFEMSVLSDGGFRVL